MCKFYIAGILLLVLSGVVAAGTSYVYGNGQLIAHINSSGNITFYLSDHLGSSSVISKENGKVIFSADYLPFGLQSSGLGSFRYGFTRKEFDSDMGMNYFGARYYSPELGRFLTVDPVMQGFSPYVYGNNNPLRYVDPDGNKAKENRALGIAIRGGAKLIKWNKRLMKVPVIGSVVKKVNIVYTGFYAGESICMALKAAKASGNPNIEAAPTIMDDLVKPVGAAIKVLAKRTINYFSPINLFGANEAYATEGGGSGDITPEGMYTISFFPTSLDVLYDETREKWVQLSSGIGSTLLGDDFYCDGGDSLLCKNLHHGIDKGEPESLDYPVKDYDIIEVTAEDSFIPSKAFHPFYSSEVVPPEYHPNIYRMDEGVRVTGKITKRK